MAKTSIFISWSGARARLLAEGLHSFLQASIQALDPFFSPESLTPGTAWSPALREKLKECAVGIVCVTSMNKESTWLNFEAGALAGSFGQERVIPVLLDIAPAQLAHPLGSFQAIGVARSEILSLAQTLNGHLDDQLDPKVLEQAFSANWAKLKTAIEAAKELEVEQPARPNRTAEEMFSEIVVELRELRASKEVLRRHGEGIDAPTPEGPKFKSRTRYEDAIDAVLRQTFTSTTMLSRTLNLVQWKADNLLKTMEQSGVVGPKLPNGKRKVLMTRKQWIVRQHEDR